MGNIIEAYNAGQQGANRGLPMGDGLRSISQAINGVQRGRVYTVAAPPKGGKSTFVDSGFVIEPCLYVLEHNGYFQTKIEEIRVKLQDIDTSQDMRDELNLEFNNLSSKLIDLEIIYNSYEIDRVSKEFDFMAHFINRDFNVYEIPLPQGKLYKEQPFVILSSAYLRGELQYDVPPGFRGEPEMIKVRNDIFEMIKITYVNRIIPLFGEYDKFGHLIKKGLMIFLEYKDNPTGIRNYLLDYATKNGTFTYSNAITKEGQTIQRIIGYIPKNPFKYTIIVTDHLRKLIPERGFNLKQTVDKFSEYAVEFRNFCQFSFVHIIHLNRSMTDVQRMKFDGDKIFPKSDDIKETGNLSEDSNYVFTMFDPNDDRYKLNTHFELPLRSPAPNSSLYYPNMKTIHLVESRHCWAPQHFRINMFGEIKKFTQFTPLKHNK